MMRREKYWMTALTMLWMASTTLAAKPNILLIYSDDHGWADLGEQGVNGDIRTPNLDQLVRDGMRFSRGYVSAPQCVPSRAGVLTGRYQQRFGLEDNTMGALPLEELTIAERLKPAGYLTGQVGKWHLDLRRGAGTGKVDRSPLPEHMPHGQGFDEYWRGEITRFYASQDLHGQPFADAPHVVMDSRFRVTVQTEAALSFLNRREAKPEQPWFLYLAYFTPHVPLESPEPWFSKTPAHLPLQRRQALAMIAAMDEGIGRIREKLRAMGKDKDTLIFFIGDNGAPTKEGHWDGSVNLPLIGEKGMLTDGGTRVPFVAAWPGTLPAGSVYEHPVISLDVAATAVALAGLPKDEKLDGVNLLPFITGENSAPPHGALFWRWRSQAAVLEFPWKLLHLGPQERYLFDVTTPEGELKNQLSQHPEIVARLDAKLGDWTQGLQPPGLPTITNDQDVGFFAEHVERKSVPKKTVADAAGSVGGWLCRNGSISVKGGALVIEPDKGATGPAFITKSQIDFLGPVEVTMRVRAGKGGSGSVSWRVRHQDDFVPEQRLPIQWPASEGEDWQEMKFAIPGKSRVIHVRIYAPPGADELQIQSISFGRAGQKAEVTRFTTEK